MAGGASLGTAYVTIVPKMNMGTVRESFTGSSMTKTASSAGTVAGGGFCSSFGSVLKGIAGLAVIQKAASSVADVFTRAFNGSAEMEQLQGGVEKIFGDAMSPRIMEDANNAWRTLNMSANEYLTSINDVGAMFKATMGAEAGYDAATRGLQAISDYASGTGKDLDMLTEKFTLITRSTGSYQSIADQFSGILPATSADFLEQAQAAGFLSDEYKKLTDVPVAEYQEALVLMLQKGTEELGLAGNTAAETMDTMSGSMAGFRSAWDNLLVSLGTGGDNMYQQLENVATMGGAVLQNGTKLFGTILSNMGIIIRDHSSEILASGMQMFGEFVKAGAQSLPQVIPSIIATILGIAVTLVENAPVILDAGIALLMGIVDSIPAVLPLVLNGMTYLQETLVSTIIGYIPNMVTAGQNLMRGLANGIGSAVDWVVGKVRELCSNAVDALKNFFGIHSPSRLMYEMGGYIGEGLANGIDATSDMVAKSWDAATAGITDRSATLSLRTAAYSSGMSTADGRQTSVASEIAALRHDLSRMGVFIEKNKLVGYMLPDIDNGLGRLAAVGGR